VQTRVLVTHGVQWLPLVDKIIVLKHGRVTESGSYEQLLSHNGPFSAFLRHHVQHAPSVSRASSLSSSQGQTI
jgi:ABC-type transport system involved in cytochrome bd biosynthesis fused ATPase/permease subunit